MRVKAARTVLRPRAAVLRPKALASTPKVVSEAAVLTKAVVRAALLLSFSQRELAHILGV